MNNTDIYIQNKLNERKSAGTYRALKTERPLTDFCSNDYLGFARSVSLKKNINNYLERHGDYLNGATGSRSLSGNTAFCEKLEADIATYHDAEAGLIFNSGYDANLGLFSSLPQRGDTIITDELIHACIIDGSRLSHANRYIFKHNNLGSLEDKLKHATGNTYVAVESVYSMDGDIAPLNNIVALAAKYNAQVIVDEAHALGVFGKGLVNSLNLQDKVFARVVTFGKALGAHGAIVLGSDMLRQYLINFARSFIFTTAASFHQLVTVKMAYEMLKESSARQQQLSNNIGLFKSLIKTDGKLIASSSGVQSIIIVGNEKTRQLAAHLQESGFDVRPILSPSVPAGTERLRICLHSFNSEQEITNLTQLLNTYQA
ncbi:aminotransferase class I/II-fold pyridoxal phosphate-dependent enzyme [Mucilaginibacter paludis]|uniref:Aminotransferase class I and II n=1 Tax=Mucilaginibacter paludis DSM 18603 TaxID=714943 RepID=H1Y9K0_9SPHI|nr:8-amino-7-oxononanoate synthase [Mucilaginibacter paludis]EHQ30502.1 aminotransferase class I and II [Mucilaginibacter paludis DSM 18603]